VTVAIVSADGSSSRYLAFVAAAWAALTASSFHLARNASLEDAPIQHFLRRFAISWAVLPPAGCLAMLMPKGIGAIFITVVLVALFGPRVLRWILWAMSERDDL